MHGFRGKPCEPRRFVDTHLRLRPARTFSGGEGPARPFEWPTWAVAAAVYGGWLALVWQAAGLPWWVVLPAGAWLTAWHGSLQHEAIHGHPSRSARINTALAWLPVGLWTPFPIYRRTHLRHHAAARLTDPATDPESFYVLPEEWRRMGRVRRAAHVVNHTLAGRLVLGPAMMIGRLWLDEARRLARGDLTNGPVWASHAAGVAAVLGYSAFVCDLPAWEYAALFAWPGLSLTLLRSFAEHEPSPLEGRRTAIVAGGPFSRLLYLNNNLHAAHHAFPALPWYALPRAWRTSGRNAPFGPGEPPMHRSYAAIAARHLFRVRDHPVHPAGCERRHDGRSSPEGGTHSRGLRSKPGQEPV